MKFEKNLKGMFFVNFNTDGEIYEQGQVVSDMFANGMCLVDIFSWLDGRHLFTKMHTTQGLYECVLFVDKEQLVEWVDDYKSNREEKLKYDK